MTIHKPDAEIAVEPPDVFIPMNIGKADNPGVLLYYTAKKVNKN